MGSPINNNIKSLNDNVPLESGEKWSVFINISPKLTEKLYNELRKIFSFCQHCVSLIDTYYSNQR